MTNANMLLHLAAQAEARGADLVTLRALIEEASDLGAARALARLGLSDENAAKDMAELRELLSAWRDASKGTFRELKRLDLIEVSLVAQPMQPLARVIAVQSLDTQSTQGETAWTMK